MGSFGYHHRVLMFLSELHGVVCEMRAKMVLHISAMSLHCSILPVQTIWDNPGGSPGAASTTWLAPTGVACSC
jgi:hypothetical protein